MAECSLGAPSLPRMRLVVPGALPEWLLKLGPLVSAAPGRSSDQLGGERPQVPEVLSCSQGTL